MTNPPSQQKPEQTFRSRARAITRSVRTQLVTLLIAITILAAVVISIMAINLVGNVSQQASDLSTASLRQQAEEYMAQINATIASQNDLILDRAARDVSAAAEAAVSIYTSYVPSGFWDPKEKLLEGPEGQYLNGPDDVSSVFVPNTTLLTPNLWRDAELSAYLDLSMPAILNNNPNAAAIYFGSVNDVTRYYPNIELGKLVPPTFQITRRPWFTACIENNPDPANPKAVWSPVYQDATGLGLVTTVAYPVFDPQGEIIGVVGLDLTLNEISKNLETTALLQSGYSFLIDQDGKAIILPDQGYADLLGREPEEDEFAVDLLATDSSFAGVLQNMVAGENGFQSILLGERELFVAYSPLPSTNWSLASVVPADEVLSSVSQLREELTSTARALAFRRVAPIVLVFLLLSIVAGLFWINRLVTPVQELTQAASRLGQGEWETPIPIKSQDEIGFLGATIADMRDRLRQSFEELEQRVEERTSDLEHRALQLQASAEVTRAIASIRDLDTLLTRITQLISQRFDYYHVGVFMLDERQEYVALRAANSPGGQRMLARQHKLRVGETGIVGTVASTREPRIALDVNLDEVWYKNPDLPDTRSEMALPLISGGKLLGVLDLQSTQESAFAQEDIVVLQILADQIAVALENALLFAENQEAMQAMRQAYGEVSRKAWESLLRTRTEIGLQLREDDTIQPVDPSWTEEMSLARERGEIIRSNGTLYTPLKLRDEVLGVVKLRKPEDAPDWAQQEIDFIQTLCDQLSMALESARLYEESQRRAERERLSGEITAKVRASNDPQVILQTAVRELRRVLNAQRAQVLIQSVHREEEKSHTQEPHGGNSGQSGNSEAER